MTPYISICVCLALVTPTIPLRAANRPHAGTENQAIKVWNNDAVAKLRDLGPISVVGQVGKERPTGAPAPGLPEVTQDGEWYAAQAARLRDELERKQTELREYRQALDDARNLRETTAGINLVGEDFAITPEAGIDILQQRVLEEQTKLDDLEELARRNDIEPGTLRGE
jgi:hypothetical protein